MVENATNPGNSVFEGMRVKKVTLEAVIGLGPAIEEIGQGEIFYCLVTLNDDLNRKFLASIETGRDVVELREVGDIEEAGEAMMEHFGDELGVNRTSQDL